METKSKSNVELRLAMGALLSNDPSGWKRYPFPMAYGQNVVRDAAWPLNGTVLAIPYDTPNMKVTQWNLSIQRQVGTDWLLSATYLGNSTTHMWSMRNPNLAVFLGLGPCTIN